jgi:hypothetical protein
MKQLFLQILSQLFPNLLPYMGQKESIGFALVQSTEPVTSLGLSGGGWGDHGCSYPYTRTRVMFTIEQFYVGSHTIDEENTVLQQGDIVKVSFKRHRNKKINKVLITTVEINDPKNRNTTQQTKE